MYSVQYIVHHLCTSCGSIGSMDCSFCLVGWVAEVRANGHGVKIVPRVLFEGWSATDYQNLFKSSSKMKELSEYLAQRTTVS